MGANVWDDQADYLAASRECMWNEDYMRFLVERVWKIDRPVRVADFGCGAGHLGGLMLPMLPEGSRYTGIDRSAPLIEAARGNLARFGGAVDFELADLTEYQPSPRFDIAICQTVLQHIPDGLGVVDRMRASAVPGGLVVCCEISRNLANAGLYFDGYDIDKSANLGILQKLWRCDAQNGGGDSAIGVKIPAYMRKIGLKDVAVRVNDYVHAVDPFGDAELHRRSLRAFWAAWGGVGGDEAEKAEALTRRGLSKEEAEYQARCEAELSRHILERADTSYMMTPMFMLISFGRA